MLDVKKIRLILELQESGISDSKILSAIEKIPREKFIPENFRNQAYDNLALPIGDNQTISQPFDVAAVIIILSKGICSFHPRLPSAYLGTILEIFNS